VKVIRDFITVNEGAAGFRLISNEVNGGQMRSIMKGFANCSGALVAFVDADDILFPDFIESHVKAHLNIDAAAGMSCSDEVVIDGSNAVIAGSIENGLSGFRPHRKFSDHLPVRVNDIENWRANWQLDAGVALRQNETAILYVPPSGNIANRWIWTTTSAVMFRRGILDLALTDSIADIRICADFFLLHFSHLIGGTLLIRNAHGFYRRHGSNQFALNAVIGAGAAPGESTGEYSFDRLWRRVRSEVIGQFPRVSKVIGTRRSLMAVALVASLLDCLTFKDPAATNVLFTRITLLTLFLIIRLKRFFIRARRILKLI
jgi:glycosyltransferase involved in cell wall biosynthesis